MIMSVSVSAMLTALEQLYELCSFGEWNVKLILSFIDIFMESVLFLSYIV